jgi:pimeloyl-ACP methyl ester carboxylesterase
VTDVHHDRDRRALEAAERRLFGLLGIEHRSARLALFGAPVDHIRVLEAGDGPPLLLLLHGAGMSAPLWAPLLPYLRHRRCIAVDLPGCGLTDACDHRGVDPRQHARSLLTATLDALRLEAVPTVANSLGATYSLYLAAVEPDRFSCLVLLGAPGVALPAARGSIAMALYSRPWLGRLLAATSPPITPRLARRMLASICGRVAVETVPDEMFEVVAATLRIREPATRSLMPELFVGRTPRPQHALTDYELARISTPTRFVWGSDDRFQSPEAGRRATAVMPDAGVTEVPGGHHPWWDDAARCAALIDEALARGARSPGADSAHPGPIDVDLL